MSDREPLTYADAGVSLDAAEGVVERIRTAVESTRTGSVLGGVGGFAGLFAPSLADPLLAAGCDGVGTKVLLGKAAGRLPGLGVDLVAMCVNDVITSGARPAFFLDVMTCGTIVPERIAALVEGIADGCRQAQCVLLGGETAEHPDMMGADDFDLAGFCVGMCERREMIGGALVGEGQQIIALASSGPHSNGFSLIRRLIDRAGVSLDDTPADLGGSSVADALLEPTRIYARAVRALSATLDVRGMAHITGGGIPGNLTRTFPQGLGAEIDMSSWERPAVFSWLAALGVEEDEMRRVFNLGVGFACVVGEDDVELALRTLESAGQPAWVAGRVVKGEGVTLR
ncbi:MAG TPA: phosphoribosylformylglycinamidine cyclo-ligase [Gaiellales bacterium]|nr:phosphoribosylformylglycinamidine cyclo-ligase [Gaiellales bacterium]